MSQNALRILVVDDEPDITNLLCRWLSMEGYECTAASNGEEALNILAGATFDLMVSDITMPGISGIALLSFVTDRFPDMAVFMATAIRDQKTAVLALQLGAYGYSIKPFDRDELLINVSNAFERRRVTLLMKEYERNLEQKVKERTAQVRRREEQIVLRLLAATGYRDVETGDHIRRIGLYSAVIAKELGWGGQAVEDIKLAAPMHDVGKIGIPDSILQKPGKLTSEEFAIMKTHTEIGGKMLDDPEIPLLTTAREIALSHHEKWDGSGYPFGLARDAIPETGRIVAVVDVYDALMNDRAYSPALPEDEALSLMRMGKGNHFDPKILDCFLDLLTEIQCIGEDQKELGNPVFKSLTP